MLRSRRPWEGGREGGREGREEGKGDEIIVLQLYNDTLLNKAIDIFYYTHQICIGIQYKTSVLLATKWLT